MEHGLLAHPLWVSQLQVQCELDFERGACQPVPWPRPAIGLNDTECTMV